MLTIISEVRANSKVQTSRLDVVHKPAFAHPISNNVLISRIGLSTEQLFLWICINTDNSLHSLSSLRFHKSSGYSIIIFFFLHVFFPYISILLSPFASVLSLLAYSRFSSLDDLHCHFVDYRPLCYENFVEMSNLSILELSTVLLWVFEALSEVIIRAADIGRQNSIGSNENKMNMNQFPSFQSVLLGWLEKLQTQAITQGA